MSEETKKKIEKKMMGSVSADKKLTSECDAIVWMIYNYVVFRVVVVTKKIGVYFL